MGDRIYSEKINIKSENTKTFYDKRAQSMQMMDNPYVAVLLGDQDPNHAAKWNDFEKRFIQPQLRIDWNSIVLDIGSGIGRWAESLIPICGKYIGTDYSIEMVKTASERCCFPKMDYEFYNLSFQETVNHHFDTKFNRLIVAGVCMYINDADLLGCYDGVLKLLDEKCIIYFTETVGIRTRLTLDEMPSEALKTTYDVIYRTPEEYCEYYKIFIDAAFKTMKQDYLPHLNDEKEFNETDRWYTILER